MSDINCNYGGGNCGPTVTTTPTTTTSIGVPVTHSDSGLPFTGGDVIGLSLVGIGAIIVGSFLARTRRRVMS